MTAETKRGFAVAAAVSPEVIRAAASEAEALHYASFWVNYVPNASGLSALGPAAAVTGQIGLGVGVVPLSFRGPDEIIDEIQQANLPLDRLILGVGSGSGAHPLRLVRAGVAQLRNALPVEIVVAALGPQMCRLAGAEADGVLFNWLTPEYARQSAEWVRDAAEAAGRRPPTLYAYVRTALGPDAPALVAREGARYAAIPFYAAHFTRMGVAPEETAIVAQTPEQIQSGLQAWNDIVDVVIVRAITAADTVDQTLALVQAAHR